MKKGLSLVMAAALAAGLLTGCGASGGQEQKVTTEAVKEESKEGESKKEGSKKEESKNETVKITYLSRFVNPELVRAGYYIEKLNQFREENPNIEIEDISIGDDSEAFKAKINAGVASGDLPDLFIANNGFPLAQWVENGLVADLTEVVKSPDWTDPSSDEMLEAFTFGGKVYGVPNALNTGQVFVNTGLLKEHGITQVPRTWEEIEAMAPVLNEAGIVPFGVAAKSKAEVGRFISALSCMMYGIQFRDQLADAAIKWDGEEGMSIAKQFKTFIDEGVLDPDAVSFEVQDTISLFEQKQVAMMYTAAYHFDRFQQMEFSDDIVCVNFPSFSDKPENKDIWIASASEGFMISSKPGTPEYDAACRLLSFMLSADTFKGYAERNGGGAFPVDFDFDLSKAKNVVGSFMEEFSKRSASTDEFTAYLNNASLVDTTRTEFQSLFVGRSPEEVCKTLAEQYSKEGR